MTAGRDADAALERPLFDAEHQWALCRHCQKAAALACRDGLVA
jgi:hypothetical protein